MDLVIVDEIEHLTNNQNHNEVQQIFGSLLKDEARHAKLSNDYLKGSFSMDIWILKNQVVWKQGTPFWASQKSSLVSRWIRN